MKNGQITLQESRHRSNEHMPSQLFCVSNATVSSVVKSGMVKFYIIP
jgi:hypothetical protein